MVDFRTELLTARARERSLEGQLRKLRGCGSLEDLSIQHDAGMLEEYRNKAETGQLRRENAALRDTILALFGEVYGARLAAKYLDKELAGRIQQLQLLGREMRGNLRDKLWRQLEAEILLQRHKTVVRACRSTVKESLSCKSTLPLPASLQVCRRECVSPEPCDRRLPPIMQEPPLEPRRVLVKRAPNQGLGISITGGREHGVPVLISELEVGGPAARCGQLYVGDAILAVNNIDLTQACHKEAVVALQAQTGDCSLLVHFVAADSEDSDDLLDLHYPLFPTETKEKNLGALAVTPTAPRTPDYNKEHLEDYSDYETTSALDHIHLMPRKEQPCSINLYNSTDAIYDSTDFKVQKSIYATGYDGYIPGNEYVSNNNRMFTTHNSIVDCDDNLIKIETTVNEAPDATDTSLKQESGYPTKSASDNIVNHNYIPSMKSLSSTDSTNSPMQTSSDNVVSPMTTSHPPQINESKEAAIEVYDRFDNQNQNVGFLYPKLANIKHFGLTQYEGLISDMHKNDLELTSSNNSVESTPVHGRKPPLVKTNKKKRVKAGDWKSKGAYEQVSNLNSSDMESPERKPVAKSSYKNDKFSFGVKTIQSAFAATQTVESEDSHTDSSSELLKPRSSECERLRSSHDKPLMRFTPERALSDGPAAIVKTETVKFETENAPKSRAFRVGSAQRVPPPPDVVRIPLKLDPSTPTEMEEDRSLDETLKLALRKLERSMLGNVEDALGMTSSAEDPVRKKKTSRSDKDNRSGKDLNGAISSVPSYLTGDNVVLEGKGDPDFGTPV